MALYVHASEGLSRLPKGQRPLQGRVALTHSALLKTADHLLTGDNPHSVHRLANGSDAWVDQFGPAHCVIAADAQVLRDSNFSTLQFLQHQKESVGVDS